MPHCCHLFSSANPAVSLSAKTAATKPSDAIYPKQAKPVTNEQESPQKTLFLQKQLFGLFKLYFDIFEVQIAQSCKILKEIKDFA
ncbi:MAG: hypothetical protein ACOYJR_04880 [Acutalibacteraceae bacterium]